jgi:hypothetical protein
MRKNNEVKSSSEGEWTRGHVANRTERRHRIEFLFRLADTDLGTLALPEHAGDLKSLAYVFFIHALQKPSHELAPSEKLFPTDAAETFSREVEANPSMLRPAIDAVRRLLAAQADQKDLDEPMPPVTRRYYLGTRKAGERMNIHTPDMPDLGERLGHLVWLLAARRLDSDEGDLVHRCKRDACRKVFFANRPNQEFCSPQCGNAAAFQRHKAKVGEDAYRAKHAKAVRESKGKGRRHPGSSAPAPRAPAKAMPANVGA